ncbi:MAG: hypothetical protein JOZ96_29875 [Acidobacteria bacterium]|nr:hypothetical protein [Acidobacteriota bacterium]
MKKRGKEIREGRQPEPASSVYDSHALASLRKGLRQVYYARGRSVKEADALLTRLTVNLRLLDYLYRQARETLRGDSKAAVAFHRALQRLVERYPKFRGSTQVLLDRVGIPRPTRGALAVSSQDGPPPQPRSQPRRMTRATRMVPPGRRGTPGMTVRYAGMATIYMAIWDVYILRPGDLPQSPVNELPRALDVVVGLSLGHGHLEALSGSLTRGGLEGLDGLIGREELLGNPYFPPGGGLDDPGSPFPDPGDPFGDPFPEPFPDDGPGGGPDDGPIPGHLYPPPFDESELIREGCEALLIELTNEGLPPVPTAVAGGSVAGAVWADNIESIELLGRCAGDTIVVNGHDFGSPQPTGVNLVMKVNGACAIVPVAPANWSDTRIEVVLPVGVMPGPVGFYNSLAAEAARGIYNGEVNRYNEAVRELMAASKCLGQPLDIPTFPVAAPGSDYIPYPPETDVNVVEVGLPVINSFTAATDSSAGTVVVVDPEDELVLRWDVENVDAIAVRRLSSTGQRVITDDVRLSSYELGRSGHDDFGENTYSLTARNVCGEIDATVRVILSKRPRLAIERIEVTQSIQTAENDVPLVRLKPTVVRVYGTHGLDGFGGKERVDNVTGRMRVHSGGAWSSWFSPINHVAANPPDPPLPDPDSSIDLPESPDPMRTNDTLNFVIPESLCDGLMSIEVEMRVDDFGAPSGPQGSPEDSPQTGPGFDELVSETFQSVVTFRQRQGLKMRYIPATFVADSGGSAHFRIVASNPPTEDECRDFLLETFKFLPTMPSSIERLEDVDCTLHADRADLSTPWGTISIDSGWSESLRYDVEGNAILFWLGVLRACEMISFTGVECTDDQDSYWVVIVPVEGGWGRANGIPGREYFTSMEDVKGAHELGHCLNQHHLVGAGCSGGGDAVASPNEPTTDPANWDDDGEILPDVAVPFDVIRNDTRIDPEDGVWDLMAYCRTRWTTPQRWKAIFDFIGD